MMNNEARKINLIERSKPVFEFEGVVYYGSLNDAIDNFILNRAYPADFHVWLQDTYKVYQINSFA